MRSPVNHKSILGLDKTSGHVRFREDRSTRNFIFFSHVIPTQLGIRSRFLLTGMLAPRHGDPDAIEALEHETFILFGTPERILKAVKTIEKRW